MRQTPSRLLHAVLATSLLLFGSGCGGPSVAEQQATVPVKLVVWRTFDGQDTLSAIMTNYQKLHPNISFEYRELRVDEYKNELVRAFAEGRGPDIFSLHNDWIGEEIPLIAPMPKTLSIPFVEIKGTLKKERVVTLKTEATVSLRQLRNEFLDTVSDDVVRPFQATPKSPIEQRIYGLPLSVDSMALFYNRHLLNAANIATPPTDWETFQKNAVPKLTSIGPNDVIVQSGAALGTSRNVERSFDLLSLLMMQNGADMNTDRGGTGFADVDQSRISRGGQAVRFYTDFANPVKESYAWNAKQPGSFEAFVNGKTAFFFGYSYHIPLLRAQNPKLKFGIAPMPQIGTGAATNYANYWVETVAKASKNQNWGWDFIQFATSAAQVSSYLKSAHKPPARKALINSFLEDEDLAVFANQLLTAKTWYRGNNAAVAEQAFLNLIDIANSGGDIDQATGEAQNKVNQTL